jgi:hypothetical protein
LAQHCRRPCFAGLPCEQEILQEFQKIAILGAPRENVIIPLRAALQNHYQMRIAQAKKTAPRRARPVNRRREDGSETLVVRGQPL